VLAYYKSFKLPVIMTRGNNVYGPHQFPEKIVPKFALLLARNKPLPVHGSGAHTRSFLYVTDVADAMEVRLARAVCVVDAPRAHTRTLNSRFARGGASMFTWVCVLCS